MFGTLPKKTYRYGTCTLYSGKCDQNHGSICTYNITSVIYKGKRNTQDLQAIIEPM